MIIEVRKIHKRRDIQQETNDLVSRYGAIENLHHRVLGDRCGNPSTIDDYILWKALNAENCEYLERIIVDSPNIFRDLSPKRVELLEYVKTHEVGSIANLAVELGRNYKNVYDDLRALQKWGLISLPKRGRDRKPVSQVESLRVTLRR
ncbi:MAG: hypothetical protein ACE5KV_09075 [Thermoplasmata archaeon]